MNQITDYNERKLSNIHIPKSITAILTLWYTAAMLIASEATVVSLYNAHMKDIIILFDSRATALIIFHIVIIIVSLWYGVLQAFMLSLLYSALCKHPRPTLHTSWGYLMIGQLPFMLSVLILYGINGFSGASIVSYIWIKQFLGAVSVCIFVYCITRGKQLGKPQYVAYSVIAVACNAAIVMLTGQSV